MGGILITIASTSYVSTIVKYYQLLDKITCGDHLSADTKGDRGTVDGDSQEELPDTRVRFLETWDISRIMKMSTSTPAMVLYLISVCTISYCQAKKQEVPLMTYSFVEDHLFR